MIIARAQVVSFVTQIERLVFHLGRWQGIRSPRSETSQALRKGTFAGGTVSFPHALLELLTKFSTALLGSVSDCDQHMEKTQHHRDLIAQSFPRVLRGLPAIGLDGFWAIIGIDRLRFVGKDPIGLLSVRLRG
jgi:hypothetical protein